MSNLAFRTTHIHWLLRQIHRPLARFAERRALDRYALLADRLLAQLIKDRQGEFQLAAPRIVKAIRTRSDVAVFLISDSLASAVAKVLKLPLTPDAEQSTSLHRQVVVALHQQAELQAFCELVPQALSWGEFEGQSYYLETAVAGVAASDLVRQGTAPAGLKQMASRAIRQLHAGTLRRQVVDTTLFAKLAANDLALMCSLAERWPEAALLQDRLHSLEALLRHELYGRELPFSWSHGDYWPGNILVDPVTGKLGGIVDWDRALQEQLPLLDVLHLLAFTRKMQRRSEVGEEIVTYLLPARFDLNDRLVIDETFAALGLPENPEFLMAATLLYWLRFAAANLSRYPALQLDHRWLSKNVFVVLKRGIL